MITLANDANVKWIILAIGVFFIAFFGYQFFTNYDLSFSRGLSFEQKWKTYNVEGLTIISKGNPGEVMSRILSPPKITIEEQFDAGKTDNNSAIAVMGAEMAHALITNNKTVQVYGLIEGIPSVNCAATRNCTGAQVVVKISTCNCLRVGDTMSLEGNKYFQLANAVKMRDIINLVLSGNQSR